MNITVYCASAPGDLPIWNTAANDLGGWIARNGHQLVYGGADVGLMGTLADAVLAGNGIVHGVVPRFLCDREIAHHGLTELEIVETMSQRKERMIELGDVFIALPGGPGPLEEISEIFSLIKLKRPPGICVLYDIGGFYAPLVELLDSMQAHGFLLPHDRARIHRVQGTAQLSTLLENGMGT